MTCDHSNCGIFWMAECSEPDDPARGVGERVIIEAYDEGEAQEYLAHLDITGAALCRVADRTSAVFGPARITYVHYACGCVHRFLAITVH